MPRHLLAAVLAFALLSTGLTGAGWYVGHLKTQAIGALAPRMFDLKNQGGQLQTEAFRHPELLVVYGSSELEMPNPYHANTVFASYPAGFRVFAVGRGSTTSLVMLQDLATVGSELRGKKVVISVSPPWFFLHDRTPDFYMANYSPLHLSALVFSTDLSLDTKQRAIQQLRQSPALFEADPLVGFAADALTRDDALGQAEYLAVLPLGKLHNALQELQDEWATARFLQSHPSASGRPSMDANHAALDWPSLLRSAEQEQMAASSNNPLGFDNQIWSTKYAKLVAQRTGAFTDAWFVDNVQHSAEWTDLAILLQGIHDLGGDALLLSQPIAGKYYDTIGISATARAEYYARLRQVAVRFNVPLVDFHDHDDDIYFVSDPNSHLSRKGWVYYDRALDAFYQGTLDQLAHTDWPASAVLPGDFAGVAAVVR